MKTSHTLTQANLILCNESGTILYEVGHVLSSFYPVGRAAVGGNVRTLLTEEDADRFSRMYIFEGMWAEFAVKASNCYPICEMYVIRQQDRLYLRFTFHRSRKTLAGGGFDPRTASLISRIQSENDCLFHTFGEHILHGDTIQMKQSCEEIYRNTLLLAAYAKSSGALMPRWETVPIVFFLQSLIAHLNHRTSGFTVDFSVPENSSELRASIECGSVSLLLTLLISILCHIAVDHRAHLTVNQSMQDLEICLSGNYPLIRPLFDDSNHLYAVMDAYPEQTVPIFICMSLSDQLGYALHCRSSAEEETVSFILRLKQTDRKLSGVKADASLEDDALERLLSALFGTRILP